MSTPSAIDMTEVSAVAKSSRPLVVPTASVSPTSPAAPGTRSQNAGRKVSCDGAPLRRVATQSTTGVIASAPMKPLTVGLMSVAAIDCAVYATSIARSIQPNTDPGAEKCR